MSKYKKQNGQFSPKRAADVKAQEEYLLRDLAIRKQRQEALDDIKDEDESNNYEVDMDFFNRD